MSKNKKFMVQSPLGYIVGCSAETWDEHILEGHPIMKGNEQTVIDALERPIVVYRSGSYEDRHVYFGSTENASYKGKLQYTKVIVDNAADGTHNMKTAFPSRKMDGNIDGGELLYVDRKPRPK